MDIFFYKIYLNMTSFHKNADVIAKMIPRKKISHGTVYQELLILIFQSLINYIKNFMKGSTFNPPQTSKSSVLVGLNFEFFFLCKYMYTLHYTIKNKKTRWRSPGTETYKGSLLNCVPYVLMCQRGLRAYVLTCQRALRACVLTCLAHIRAQVPWVLQCSRAQIACYNLNNKISFQWHVLPRCLLLFLCLFPEK